MKVNKFGKSKPAADYYLSRAGPGAHFDARNKRLVNLAPPKHDSDAVILQYVNAQPGLVKDANENFSSGGKRLVDLGHPQEGNDAATKQYVDSSRIYSFYSNLETRDARPWVTSNNHTFHACSTACKVTKARIVSSRPHNQFRVRLATDKMSLLIAKVGGETVSVHTLDLPLAAGETLTAKNDGVVAGGHHLLELHCTL